MAWKPHSDRDILRLLRDIELRPVCRRPRSQHQGRTFNGLHKQTLKRHSECARRHSEFLNAVGNVRKRLFDLVHQNKAEVARR